MLIGSLRVRKIVARLLPTNKGVESLHDLCFTAVQTEKQLPLLSGYKI